MASTGLHAVQCQNCNGTWFREERIVQLDASVVIRANLPLAAQTVSEVYQYVCTTCNTVCEHEWSHEDAKKA